MQTYTKVFNSIIYSTIWREPLHVKVLWITMLAICDKNGEIHASSSGLADAARITDEQCEEGLKKLQSPDPKSGTPDHEGRRVEKIDNAHWLILNHGKYRDLMSEEDKKEKGRIRQARYDEKKRKEASSKENPKPTPPRRH